MDEDYAAEAAALGLGHIHRRASALDSDAAGTSHYPAPSKASSAQAQDTSSQTDADTCRICRGEGTTDEPLFYPCKCSGSIKYVHQDCLMEWLSHSQKKHCELCKTPFRFTKLYAPNMPKTVPFHVFISHMAKYIFRNILVWARAALVIMVWLVWVPYLMRRVWSALFWISDEGLTPLFGRPDATPLTAPAALASVGDTCPSSPLLAQQTATTGAFSAIMSSMPSNPTSQTTASLYGINITTDNPLSNILLNLFLSSFYMGGTGIRDNASAVLQNVTAPILSHHPSLLSEVKFLRKLLLASPALGGFVIDVLEGQIITVVVVICFILIILVRDYVVQQQPDINMRAAFAAADNAAPVGDAAPAELPAEAPMLMQLDPTVGLAANDIDHLAGPEREDDETSMQAVDGDSEEQDALWSSNFPTSAGPATQQRSLADADANGRPDSPTANVQHNDNPSPTAEKYVRIWREAHGDAELAREIALREDVGEELAYYLNIGQARASRHQADVAGQEVEESAREKGRTGSEWDWPEEEQQHSDKGKNAVKYEGSDAAGGHIQTSRPRSATDGPQTIGGVNPLAHNNWSFSDAPSEAPRPGPAADLPGPSRWSYITPPSSTLAESASSSQSGRTPSSSDHDDLSNAAGASPQTVLQDTETPRNGGQTENWEAFSDIDTQIEPLQDTEGVAGADNQQNPPGGLAQRVADFMWRDVEAIPLHELPPLPDPADDFFDHDQEIMIAGGENPLEDAEVMAAAAAAGIDAEAEAIEDAEDLEGILELLGMRGPIAGLFQNALFCAFLVTITLLTGVFIPYNLGRLSIWLVANPIRPVRMVISLSKTVQDLAMLALGFVSTLALGCLNGIISFFRPDTPQSEMVRNLVQRSWSLMENAGGSLRDSGVTDFYLISTDEVRNFSIVSHAALLSIKSQVAMVISTIVESLLFVFGGDYPNKAAIIFSWMSSAYALVWNSLKDLPNLISSSWVIDLGSPETVVYLDPALASWSAMDRLWVILGGYVAMCVITGLYLGRGSPIAGRIGQEWETTIIELLVQASGVMKVILIIGIEMLVFPLYCGLLLDIALLPLFEDTTIMSRMMFTVNYPLTSVFVHWFVGTGYMFHFALFVSMCRKIMRKGVLYFIRDPDDAEFHPVRDVLERNVTTQLRKILFSAFVYGALVIVCLGGVVWALSYGCRNVLPIYYSSNEPVLEFPIDLLFYNFLMPLAVKFYRPSDGLHAMYTWWFRKLARALRLTWFLFGERKIDEEGTLLLTQNSPAKLVPLPRRIFLQVDGQHVVPMTWSDTFDGGHSKPALPISRDELRSLDADKMHLVETGELLPDGRFVRAPASDQVKIPKGQRVFFEVNAHNERRDGKLDHSATDIYSTNAYQFVYIPPNFRLRVFLFILFIWIFAACTGVGFTIIPLIFGRTMFRLFIPAYVRTNDIYAFSIGMYILGSAAYFAFRIRDTYHKVRDWMRNAASGLLDQESFRRAAAIATRAAKLIYTYSFLLVLCPFMVSSLMELYILIPLDTYMYGSVVPTSSDAAVEPRHTIRVMQSWTIGIIYLKLAARFPLAAATRAILRRGWLEPDVKVLTRAFVVPGLSLWCAAVFGPLMLAKTAIWYNAGAEVAKSLDDASAVLVYRFCFASALLCAIALTILRSIFGVFRSWRVRIKDEAYLIGERLHNFSSPQQILLDRERERRRTRVGFE
ncbi:hypothetical protein N0V93_005289 [Gnomoniopsis smithogilvyi]|uniref:RING-type E3 ubiquitin transferase n=1 Tax=Gnomoniopsis smithogilvyi TaxID=1191159 RepID=A0A9W9CXW8_9PEZI|nr:hypothetical protein N0V93_005289 [Gnomoniopsis smithogilvyi]